MLGLDSFKRHLALRDKRFEILRLVRINVFSEANYLSKVGRPSLITWKGTPAKVKKHIFSLDEEMGFSRFDKVITFTLVKLLMLIAREELRKMVVEHPSLLKVLHFLLLNPKLKTPLRETIAWF